MARFAAYVGAVEVTPAALPAGVTANSGVQLTPEGVAFLGRLHRTSGVPVHVNSGTRTAGEQAAAMLTKLSQGGAQELFDTYADDAAIRELLSLPRTVDAWSARISALAAKGRMLSRHMRAGAVDLRTRDLTADQVEKLKAAATKLGGRPLYEGTPPHLHVDLPGGSTASAPATDLEPDEAMWSWPELALGAAVLGVGLYVGGPVLLGLGSQAARAGLLLVARRLA